ncbi:L-histidine N(alpha)-methyltransferase [Chitinophaga pendula]|uniref:L-histidine N(alpha)-methyltransferase n=1 Tax=Chitinophaga pendula TaxID=2849666 RepID=UPI001CEC13AA|nr:L-histidine N(alpha)-methyltransferase [Chitinophaga pendula]
MSIITTSTRSGAIGQQTSAFYKDVIMGLRSPEKKLDAKYFYDAAGDHLFQQIMQCPEYYPTRCEMEILSRQSADIVQAILRHSREFDVVELGAGDATKSIHLLRQLRRQQLSYTYFPIDISANVISSLERDLPPQLPGTQVQGLNGEYFDMLREAGTRSHRNKVVLFMGANIGNFTRTEALSFCKTIRRELQPGDLLLTGFDLKKHPQLILDAYNDRQGYTRDFNLNLLRRINRELGADFDLNQFEHYPTYDPQTGACKSYLVSRTDQQVHIGEVVIHFREGEPIYMEISQKYSIPEIENLAAEAGFYPATRFTDSRSWFMDTLWVCK